MKIEFIAMTLFTLLILGLGYAGNSDVESAETESALYAEMVCLGRETGQQFGWPNYLNLEINCTEIN